MMSRNLPGVVPITVPGHGGVTINVWDFGGEGPPLFLLHCTGTHGRVWDPVVVGLQNSFHVYSVDSRGHGLSDKPPPSNAYLWRNSGLDLLAAIDQIEVDGPILTAGHSAGGTHVLYAELERPGTFERMLLIEPGIVPTEFVGAPNPLAQVAKKRRNRFTSSEEALMRFAAKPPMNKWSPEALDAYVRFGLAPSADGRLHLQCPPEVEAEILQLRDRGNLFEHLRGIETEITLITGAESAYSPIVPRVREQFNAVCHETLQGLGHFIPQQAPELTASIILRHLNVRSAGT